MWDEKTIQKQKNKQTDFITTQCSLMWLNADITKGFGDYYSNNRPESIGRNFFFLLPKQEMIQAAQLTQISASRRSIRNSWKMLVTKSGADFITSKDFEPYFISSSDNKPNQIYKWLFMFGIGKCNSYNSLVAYA